MKRCPFDSGFIKRETQTMWRCTECRMPFHGNLVTDKRMWSRFRKFAKIRIEAMREGGMSDEEIRPALGALWKVAYLDAQEDMTARA